MAAQRKVDTATLIRGDQYAIRHPDNTAANPKESLRFQLGVPTIIEEKKILEILENLHDEIEDGDGEIYEKPRFHIQRGVTPPEDENARSKPKRLSPTRSVKRRKRA